MQSNQQLLENKIDPMPSITNEKYAKNTSKHIRFVKESKHDIFMPSDSVLESLRMRIEKDITRFAIAIRKYQNEIETKYPLDEYVILRYKSLAYKFRHQELRKLITEQLDDTINNQQVVYEAKTHRDTLSKIKASLIEDIIKEIESTDDLIKKICKSLSQEEENKFQIEITQRTKREVLAREKLETAYAESGNLTIRQNEVLDQMSNNQKKFAIVNEHLKHRQAMETKLKEMISCLLGLLSFTNSKQKALDYLKQITSSDTELNGYNIPDYVKYKFLKNIKHITEYLSNPFFKPTEIDKGGYTALHYLCIMRHFESAKKLKDTCPTVNFHIRNPNKLYYPFQYILMEEHATTRQFLQLLEPSIEQFLSEEKKPNGLIEAIDNNNYAAVEYIIILIEKRNHLNKSIHPGINTDYFLKTCSPALLHACFNSNDKVISFLLEKLIENGMPLKNLQFSLQTLRQDNKINPETISRINKIFFTHGIIWCPNDLSKAVEYGTRDLEFAIEQYESIRRLSSSEAATLKSDHKDQKEIKTPADRTRSLELSLFPPQGHSSNGTTTSAGLTVTQAANGKR